MSELPRPITPTGLCRGFLMAIPAAPRPVKPGSGSAVASTGLSLSAVASTGLGLSAGCWSCRRLEMSVVPLGSSIKGESVCERPLLGAGCDLVRGSAGAAPILRPGGSRERIAEGRPLWRLDVGGLAVSLPGAAVLRPPAGMSRLLGSRLLREWLLGSGRLDRRVGSGGGLTGLIELEGAGAGGGGRGGAGGEWAGVAAVLVGGRGRGLEGWRGGRLGLGRRNGRAGTGCRLEQFSRKRLLLLLLLLLLLFLQLLGRLGGCREG